MTAARRCGRILDAARSQGYVCLSRTGIDLFRPLVTLRLPIADMETSAKVIYDTLDPGTAVILNAPASYLPLLQGLFEIHREDHLQLYVLDQEQFEPIIKCWSPRTSPPIISPASWSRIASAATLRLRRH